MPTCSALVYRRWHNESYISFNFVRHEKEKDGSKRKEADHTFISQELYLLLDTFTYYLTYDTYIKFVLRDDKIKTQIYC